MRRTLKSISLVLAAAALPVSGSLAAEPVKLRPIAPIYLDEKGGGIRQPEGVGCGSGSLFLVADSGNGRIVKYDVTSNNVTANASIVLPQIPYPIRVQADSKGEIYALDGRLRRIGRIASSGEFQGYVDISSARGGAVIPRSFRIGKDDHLYVLDVFSARVIVADRTGKVQREIPFPATYGFFSDLAVDQKGNIFLIDSVRKTVYSAPKGSEAISALPGKLEEHVSFPTSITVDERGYIFVTDQNGNGIIVVGPDGSFRSRHLSQGWKNGFLRYPAQICIDDNGNLFVANRGNNRIEVLLTAQ